MARIYPCRGVIMYIKFKIKTLTTILIIGTMLLSGCTRQTEIGNEIIKDANELHNLVDDYNLKIEGND